jgi:hypothetical protein
MLQNAFFELGYSDPYLALSFDRMHFNHGGLWGDHLWPELKLHVKALGRQAEKQLDNLSVLDIPFLN